MERFKGKMQNMETFMYWPKKKPLEVVDALGFHSMSPVWKVAISVGLKDRLGRETMGLEPG